MAEGTMDVSDASAAREQECLPETPRLQYLAVRCNDRPIDLVPAFSPAQYVYSAELDFAEPGFAVDAVPAEGSRFANADKFSSTQLVAPGARVTSKLEVEDVDGKAKNGLEYSVRVVRLTGEEAKAST
ncbi:unnamed protein product [Symbiodinium natans]|uniref:Uncharacterized protein n=1 Tax=Symbiodinium natans TaxID=878477 RepID=A0A812RFV2_9DINO|nr:unnamed protein product [Symbiodinium natans]